ncbi:hypothetical protein [Nocardia sp. NPDC048505]|uniref:hypothetical protein n=1 Tax=unclassified Nocardia TaxID=2637762 RepID=UPI0033D7E0D5
MIQQPPCVGRPGFLQPDDVLNWHELPETAAAQALCRERCPRDTFLACALSALTAGAGSGGDRQRAADGVVMAGIACRGDDLTVKALRNVIKVHTPVPARRPAACLSCHRPMTTRHRKLPGHVIHEAGGHCTRCRRGQQRAA